MEKFIETHLKLLDLEREAEIEETRVLTEKLPPKELQRRGVCLLKLVIGGRKTGLYGRTILSFEASGGIKELPSHNITPGDIVGLCQTSGDPLTDSVGSGIVIRVGKTEVNVAFDDNQDLISLNDESLYRLTKLANDVTYKRIKDALNRLLQAQSQPCSHLAAVLFEETELSPSFDCPEIHHVNSNLDDSQKEAVRFALSQPEIAVVHGPPGTGKTTTVIEIIIQAVKQGKKVLACAPSNIAVDNLVERLAANKQKIVRLGHPARVLHHIQKYSLDAILSTSDDTKLVEDVRSDMDKALSKLKKTRDKGERQRMREEMKSLRKELIQREKTAIKQILKKADVVLATTTSASADGPLKLLDLKHFDLGVIDECSQAIEAACWIPLLRVPRCILAGDHLQLPPTILSKEAAKTGLETTLMERVLDRLGNKVMRMLTTQYRMNQVIMQWSSDQLYDGKLVAHSSVSDHLLRDIPGITDNEDTSQPLLLVDTAGCELYELDLPEEISKGNEGEADILASHVEKLVSMGLKQQDIAVIAPYNLQVELLRLRLTTNYPKVEIKSVDGFQGREKEAVLISLVRSNPKDEVGFLAERRRINVAITRARRHLMVVCDSETVGHDKFLKSLMEYMTSHGEVQTAHQYEVKFQNGMECVKLLSMDKQLNLRQFNDKTPYTIMFGPDKCGMDHKLHFIFRHKNPKTGVYEEKHAKKPTANIDRFFSDKKTHLYTLVVNPDNSFEMLVDNTLVNEGTLLDDVSPPVNPPKEIEDPNDKKPEDWDEREKIQDPDASKPDDWDESEPEYIVDDSTAMPSGWLEDESELIPDPDAEKPDDWDEDMDGEWEPPQVDNPKCKDAPGCGKWDKPQVKNPKYKGKWRSPMVDNPDYKGIWEPRKITNPDFFEDLEPYKMTPINALGLELWSMSDEIVFDNFIITDDKVVASSYASQTWEIKSSQEKAVSGERSVVDAILDATRDRPWLWAVFLVVVVLPIVLIIAYCCFSKSQKGIWQSLRGAADDRPWLWAVYVVVLLLPVLLLSICLCPRSGPIKPEVIEEHRKKTDEPSPDDENKEAENEEEVGPKGDNPETGKKTKKSDLDVKEENSQDDEGDDEGEGEEEEKTEDKSGDSPRRTSPRKRRARKE